MTAKQPVKHHKVNVDRDTRQRILAIAEATGLKHVAVVGQAVQMLEKSQSKRVRRNHAGQTAA